MGRTRFLAPLALLPLALLACAPTPDSPALGPSSSTPFLSGVERAAAPFDAASQELPLVVFLGDSLTAGYGLPQAEAYPALLQQQLAQAGLPFRGVNAGVSGDTSAGGVERLDWLLRQHPDVLVLELGANDGLRGLPAEHTESNLRQIIERTLAAGTRVLLLGMQVPTNYGPEYASEFAGIFPALAEATGVPLVDFLLDGVGGRPELNLADGIHPTAAGHHILADNVRPELEALLRELEPAYGQ